MVAFMNKLPLVFFIILLISTSFIFLCVNIYVFPLKHAVCSGNISFYKDGMAMRLSSKINYSHGNGILYLDGAIYNDKTITSTISRAISFQSINVDNRFTWTSTGVTKSMEENISSDVEKKWLLPFYTSQNSKIKIYIDRINLDSYLVSGELTPYYICSRK